MPLTCPGVTVALEEVTMDTSTLRAVLNLKMDLTGSSPPKGVYKLIFSHPVPDNDMDVSKKSMNNLHGSLFCST